MALRVRYQYTPGSTLYYAIERLADGLPFDFGDGTFKATPSAPTAPLAEGTGVQAGRYSATLESTPTAQFPDGAYAVSIVEAGMTIDVLADLMHGGDDGPVFPSGAGMDPWSAALPGTYPAGSAGALLGTNLDARVSSRSVYAGGPVASVAAPVTVGANNDKAGYGLSAAERTATAQVLLALTDAVESGEDLRGTLRLLRAFAAGLTVVNLATGVDIFKRKDGSEAFRVTHDMAGNRTAVVPGNL